MRRSQLHLASNKGSSEGVSEEWTGHSCAGVDADRTKRADCAMSLPHQESQSAEQTQPIRLKTRGTLGEQQNTYLNYVLETTPSRGPHAACSAKPCPPVLQAEHRRRRRKGMHPPQNKHRPQLEAASAKDEGATRRDYDTGKQNTQTKTINTARQMRQSFNGSTEGRPKNSSLSLAGHGVAVVFCSRPLLGPLQGL